MTTQAESVESEVHAEFDHLYQLLRQWQGEADREQGQKIRSLRGGLAMLMNELESFSKAGAVGTSPTDG